MKLRETIHSMTRRCNGWDYHSPSIYMITFSLADRSKPLLGDLVIHPPEHIPPSPYEIKAHIEHSELGKAVLEIWKKLPQAFPEITPLLLQLMPEHLHGILHVTRQMPKHLGQIICSFKGKCSNAYWDIMPEMRKISLFEDDYQDTILFRKGQLDNMLSYALDNPRRLAVKRMFPNLFQEQRLIQFAGGFFSGIGNHFLLDYPVFRQVQVSRYGFYCADFDKIKRSFMTNIQFGTALVSPCISEGERKIAYEAIEHNVPVIILKNNGFDKYYKPSGKLFDACAAGRLLMLAPSAWKYSYSNEKMTREKACVLNALAQRICGNGACEISYNGYVPPNLDQLVQEALVP